MTGQTLNVNPKLVPMIKDMLTSDTDTKNIKRGKRQRLKKNQIEKQNF